jgi:hypothetical protein
MLKKKKVDWIHLAQDMAQRRALANIVMNLGFITTLILL